MANSDDLAELARQALEDQQEEKALPFVEGAARRIGTDASLWQWAGLLHRALDDRLLALPCFEKAAQLAPTDATIAHGHARVRLEAGLPAIDDFLRSIRLAPLDGGVLLGLAAARLAEDQGEAALAGLDDVLSAHPLWLEGHQARIRLSWMLGQDDAAFDRIDSALQSHPQAQQLWEASIGALIDAKSFETAQKSIAKARQNCGPLPFLELHRAITLSNTGQASEADRSFQKLEAQSDANVALHRVRHELRHDRLERASELVEHWIARPEADAFWPYADSIWRLTGDDRFAWLNQNGALVQVMDLADRLESLRPSLAPLLRRLHKSRHQHLDQSVRGGTQTDGALLSRVEPEIRALRAIIVDAVLDYVAKLPPIDTRHPFLAASRDREPRFAGSWSVRLTGSGFHTNHVHPAGWISSALYVSLPPSLDVGDESGWLAIGEPQAELELKLDPWMTIEPKICRLVLFPSITWHGTRSFEEGERLTVAFDVATPVGSR